MRPALRPDMPHIPAGKDLASMKPEEIEALSFRIIENEAGRHAFSNDQWPIVRRIIHTTADFEYLESVRFHPRAVASGITAIRKGRAVVTDTKMARAGIRQTDLVKFGGTVACHIGDAEVARRAKAKGATRAETAVDLAASEIDGGIYAVGNAPTALLRLIELIKNRRIQPALILGFPVGFVNAAESKAALMALDTPYISNVGRKGGSNVAAAVVNALIDLAGL
jgi:precorrin-8X/cobalt-precorrin-8 methylmutase